MAGCPRYGDIWEAKKKAKRDYRDGLDENRKRCKNAQLITMRN